MRSTILVVLLGSFGWGQTLVESSAAAAGGAVGGVAGKKVSDGLTSIFEKLDKQTQKAAKATTKAAPSAATAADSNTPLLEVGPGVPKPRNSVPPPPPPIHHAAVHKTPSLPLTPRPVPMAVPQIQPTQITLVTSDELRTVTTGMTRGDVLKLGAPTAKITMYDDGHLLEIYRYLERDTNIGTVRLTDGSVSSVQLR
jgi:hypothetical protein